ncbi:MAG TPA: hypothetical protein VGU63_03945 [Candidatus Acidoferrales bacterium]|nr:hypothetical protein [Candidatus Acidoferrales bacterium]
MPPSPQQVVDQPVILSAVRTPMGKFMGGLSSLTAPELGAKVVAEAVRRRIDLGMCPKSVFKTDSARCTFVCACT